MVPPTVTGWEVTTMRMPTARPLAEMLDDVQVIIELTRGPLERFDQGRGETRATVRHVKGRLGHYLASLVPLQSFLLSIFLPVTRIGLR